MTGIPNFGIVLTVVGVYLLVVIALGVVGRLKRVSKSSSDFYLAGRSLAGIVLLFTLFATQYSGNTQVGYAGIGYRIGLDGVVVPAFFIAVIGFTLIYAPKLRSQAARGNWVTPGDYFRSRFNSRWLTRAISLVMVVTGINFILTNLIAIGLVAESLSGGAIPFWVGVTVASVVMLVYELLGGLRSVAWTDVAQGCLMLFGGLIFLVAITALAGGPGVAIERLQTLRPDFFVPPDWKSNIGSLSSIVLIGIGGSVYPQLIQRIFAARSGRVLRKALTFMVLLPFVTALPAFLWGALGNLHLPGLSSAGSDGITPLLLVYVVEQEPWLIVIVAVVTVGLVGAIMSTVDSVLLSTSSICARDIFDTTPGEQRVLRRYFGWLAPHKWGASIATSEASRGRLISIILMVVTVGLTLILGQENTIWGFIELKLGLLISCAPAIYLGLRWKSLRSQPLLVGLICGVSVTLALYTVGARPLGIHEGLWGLAINLVLVLVFQSAFKPAILRR